MLISVMGLSDDLVNHLLVCPHEEYMTIVYSKEKPMTVEQSLRMNMLRNLYGQNPQFYSAPQEDPMPKEGGCVYLIKAENGLYKIGYTYGLRKRLSQLKKRIPVPISCEHFILTETPEQLEKELHRQFAHRNFTGEWFALTAADVATIKGRG